MADSPAPEVLSASSSGRGTPQISNPGTPRSLADTEFRNTPPPVPAANPVLPPGYIPHLPLHTMATPGTSAAHRPPALHQPPPTPGQIGQVGQVGVGQVGQPQSKYAQLLAVIEDMGKDIRPTYSGSKTSAERLKRGIVHARILVRECLMECERSARS